MIQGKKFISPGTWFSMIYPSDWSEFEDGEGSFLFYNPEHWTGNFRISAYKEDAAAPGGMNYGKDSVRQELKRKPFGLPGEGGTSGMCLQQGDV